MKWLLAMVCSFALAGMPLLPAQTQAAACAKQMLRPCCHHGCTMPCCQAKQTPDSRPAPVAPAPSGSQNTLLLFAPNILTWTAPANPANAISSVVTAASIAVSAPLFALNCALLI